MAAISVFLGGEEVEVVMVPRTPVSLVLALGLLATPYLARAQDHVRRALAQRCDERVEPYTAACHDGKSSVWYYTFTDDNEPGQTFISWSYRSQAIAKRALESDQRLCQTVDRYFDHRDCSRQYSAPMCLACGTAPEPARDRAQRDLEDAAGKLFENWRTRLIGAIGAWRRATQGRNPYGDVGSVARDYAKALEQSLEKLREIERSLNETQERWRLTAEIIDEITRSDGADRTDLERRYNALPKALRDAIAGRRVDAGGDWQTHRVRGFDGSLVTQTIVADGGTIKVSYASGDGAPSSRRYEIAAADLIRDQLTVKQAEPDRWVLTVVSRQRNIRDEAIRSDGTSITETRSRVYLFFSTEQAARDAAAALGGP
jgi:hypothetical protein